MLEGLRGLLSTVKTLAKFVPNFFYFVSIDERPVTGSQPNLANKSEVVSIYKCPTKISETFPKIWGTKKHEMS